MSILIKGMKMPKACEECELNYDSFACIKTGSRFFIDKDSEFDPYKARLEDCPLVPVPEHGRLIDADALKNIVYAALKDALHDDNATFYGSALCAFIAKNIADEIEAAPTIIPADPTKEGDR